MGTSTFYVGGQFIQPKPPTPQPNKQTVQKNKPSNASSKKTKTSTPKTHSSKTYPKKENLAPSVSQVNNRGRVFNNGWNDLNGSFYYKGASYGFVISFYYDTSKGAVTNATYKATGYGGGGAVSKISAMSVSPNEDFIKITGKSLQINASSKGYGQYSGSMTRGSHSGTCSMSI